VAELEPYRRPIRARHLLRLFIEPMKPIRMGQGRDGTRTLRVDHARDFLTGSHRIELTKFQHSAAT
jgi:hypothetical protein